MTTTPRKFRKRLKRLPVIRHIRYFWHSVMYNIWWNTRGKYLGLIPSEHDMEYLERIWRGEA